MSDKITKPGVYRALPSAVYHSDCTPTPALSAGFAWTMIQRSPARAWFDSPLNPDFTPEESDRMDLGSAAHLLFLEPDRFDASVYRIDADDWRTKTARTERDRAREAGLVPLLKKDEQRICAMRKALRNELAGLPFATAPKFAARGLAGGDAEVSYFWQAAGVWCKARPDYVPDSRTLIDYKTTATISEDLGRYAHGMGWPLRAAHYLAGHKALTGEDATYWYVIQETKPPFFVAVASLDSVALDWGRIMLAKALEQFRECLASGRWPNGDGKPQTITLPSFIQYQLTDAKDAGAFDVGAEFQRYIANTGHLPP